MGWWLTRNLRLESRLKEQDWHPLQGSRDPADALFPEERSGFRSRPFAVTLPMPLDPSARSLQQTGTEDAFAWDAGNVPGPKMLPVKSQVFPWRTQLQSLTGTAGVKMIHSAKERRLSIVG